MNHAFTMQGPTLFCTYDSPIPNLYNRGPFLLFANDAAENEYVPGVVVVVVVVVVAGGGGGVVLMLLLAIVVF